jgi:hypothetical protein
MPLKLTELLHLYLSQEPCCSQNDYLPLFFAVFLIKIVSLSSFLLLVLSLLASAGLAQLKSQTASWTAVFVFTYGLINKADSSGKVCDSYFGENISNSVEDAERDARTLAPNPFKRTEHAQASMHFEAL